MEKITIDIEQKNSNGVLKEYAAKFADLKQQEKNISSSGEEEKKYIKKRMSYNSSVLCDIVFADAISDK